MFDTTQLKKKNRAIIYAKIGFFLYGLYILYDAFKIFFGIGVSFEYKLFTSLMLILFINFVLYPLYFLAFKSKNKK